MFGCLCFPWLRPYASHKLDSRSTPCVFLGYSHFQSAYFCLDRTTNRLYTSRHVVFHETVFAFAISSSLHVQDESRAAEASSSSTPSVTLIPSTQIPRPAPIAPPCAPTTQQQVQTTPENSHEMPLSNDAVPPTVTSPGLSNNS